MLKDSAILPFSFCPFCGGKESLNEKSLEECVCNKLFDVANDAKVPIEYDARTDEYYLATEDGAKIFFNYCFSCGRYLSKTLGDRFFTVPLDQEINEIKERIKGVVSIENVIRILGEPDEISDDSTSEYQKKKIYSSQDIKRTLIYKSISRTLIVYIQQFADGEIGVLFTGKPKKIKL
jgi:hypothetical protein